MRDRLSSRDFFEPADDSESYPDLLSVAVEEFCKHHDNARDWSAKTSREIRAILALFLRIVADQGVADFDNRKTSDYVQTILTLPPNINKSLRYASKSISEMLARIAHRFFDSSHILAGKLPRPLDRRLPELEPVSD